ncbi:hypothetical protein EI041_28915, partial [Escherichia coli]|nr:hypothetical protein [Escherichia coli]
EPISCARWPHPKIYRLADIETVKKPIAITREEKKVKPAASVTRSRKTKKGQPVNDNPESAQ